MRSSRRALLVAAWLVLGLGWAASGRVVHARDLPTGGLVFEREEHDFGNVPQRAQIDVAIGFVNQGSSAVTRIRAVVDCGCYEATSSHQRLEPGERATLSIRFQTLTFSGRFTKRVRLLYDEHGAAAESVLRLAVAVTDGVVVRPGRIWLGNVRLGERPRGHVDLLHFEGVGKPFRVLGATLAGARAQSSIDAFVDPREPRWKGSRIAIAFEDVPGRGLLRHELVVETDHPQMRELRIPVTAQVVGRLHVASDRVYLGIVAEGHERTALVSIQAPAPDGEPGRLVARARPGILDVRIVPAGETNAPGGNPGPTHGVPARWLLEVRLVATAPPGPIDEPIEILTDLAGEERIELRALGHVAPRAWARAPAPR